MSEEENAEESEAPKSTSMLVHALVFLLITAIASGAGFGAGMFLKPKNAAMAPAAAGSKETSKDERKDQAMAQGGNDDAGKSEDGDEMELATGYAKPLAPILTNLASPEDVWVRMELAVVGDEGVTDELLEQVHHDMLAYMRTVKLHHVDGPSGFINLKAELDERAAIRSEGKISKVLIRTILFE